MRIFLDANVLFSASNHGSNVEELVTRILKQATAITSDLAAEEARRNIVAKRLAWREHFEQILTRVQVVNSSSFALPIQLAEKDVPLLCAAIANRCDYFVTGDKKDFGAFFGKTVKCVKIVSLLQMADILLRDERR